MSDNDKLYKLQMMRAFSEIFQKIVKCCYKRNRLEARRLNIINKINKVNQIFDNAAPLALFVRLTNKVCKINRMLYDLDIESRINFAMYRQIIQSMLSEKWLVVGSVRDVRRVGYLIKHYGWRGGVYVIDNQEADVVRAKMQELGIPEVFP